MIKLHLGCGPRLIDGWVNVDLIEQAGIMNHDLRNPLPFGEGEVGKVYSEHFIEHLNRHDGLKFLKECHRVLNKSVGFFRISTPDLTYLVDAYSKNDLTRFSKVGWLPRTKAQMVNEAMHEWGHQFLYDEQELVGAMLEAGFRAITRVKKDTGFLMNLECRPDCNDLIIEAVP